LFTGWTPTGGSSFTVNGNGTVSVANGDGSADAMLHSPNYTLVIGKTYVIDIQTSSTTGTGLGLYLNSAGGPEGYLWDRTKTFVATQTSNTLFIYRYLGHNGTGTLDKVVLREAEADRSVNNKGLQVFGTVTKNAVATGADLVGYSGFSASNYLEQPYNSDLDFGTGDFSFMVWVKPDSTSSGQYVFQLNNSDGSKYIHFLAQHSSASLFNATGTAYISNGTQAPAGVWSCYCGVRRGNILELYLDGNLVSSVVSTAGDVADGTSTLTIGNRDSKTSAGAFNGNLALFRISATEPSAEQIAKIYNDEKQLFATNAKATLYGTSDVVTALAYDDDTELLHVGTSAGRSVFQGLNRVDNTTDAVGAAISASNGLVAED
jgi:hypothetical protein